MSQLAELHILKERIAELESTVELIDKGQTRQEEKLRDKFAAAALTGLLAYEEWSRPESAASYAYALADAMLVARGKE